MGLIRVNINNSANDIGAITSATHNAYAGAQKVLQVGPDFQKQGTNAYVSGQDFSTGGSVSPWDTLWIYNNSSSVAWIALSTATIAAAPTGFSNGIPLPPNSWSQLSTGPNSFVYTSAATVGVYVMNDDTAARVITP